MGRGRTRPPGVARAFRPAGAEGDAAPALEAHAGARHEALRPSQNATLSAGPGEHPLDAAARRSINRGVKLARRLTVALVLGIFAVLAVYAYSRVRRETGVFESDMRRDGHIMSRVLGTAAAEVWRTNGEAQAKQLIAQVNESESNVTIRWVSLAAPPGDRFAPRLGRAELAPVAEGREITGKARDPDGSEHLITYLPLRVGGRIEGAIELAESMAGERAYIRATITNVLLATATLALVCGAMTIGLGVWFVGRPMRSLIEQARRIGTGDLSRRLGLEQKDEIGELAGEMNAMCDRLDEANRRAAAEVARRIEALEHLRHADRLATVGKLASGVAHELGAPLQVVSARAKMIAEGDVGGAEAQEYALIIHDQVTRMAAMIRQLLDFARRKAADKAPADLVDLARKVCLLLGPIADKRHVTLSVDPERDASGRAEVMVDAEQIQQALTNLVVNGIQAMPGGGPLVIRIRRERAHPASGGADRDCVRMDVEDKGEGMPAETLERVFEPFFTTKPPGEGTGLGLAVAQEIARGHGGWIAAHSEMGSGSRFSMFVPEEPTR
jgi:two-component system NtrC family sensor kinase